MSTSDELNALLNKIIWYITYYSHGFTTTKVVKKNTSFWMLFPVKVIMYIHCRTFQENQGVDPTQPPPQKKALLKNVFTIFNVTRLSYSSFSSFKYQMVNLFINRYFNWEFRHHYILSYRNKPKRNNAENVYELQCAVLERELQKNICKLNFFAASELCQMLSWWRHIDNCIAIIFCQLHAVADLSSVYNACHRK